ncbi:MAG: AbrB/MazE/SpoVT family DNA-binding domain-containing protein [Treponema sp.]|jgi:antitoxin MazE|nr:AbrB/MazE/SpoVT family DNA-binding domain-containing protein [Treponema sp.]
MIVSVVSIGNSRGIRLPKMVLESLAIKDKVEMEVTETSIVLKPLQEAPRQGWQAAFTQMHLQGEDMLEDIPTGEDFEWEW